MTISTIVGHGKITHVLMARLLAQAFGAPPMTPISIQWSFTPDFTPMAESDPELLNSDLKVCCLVFFLKAQLCTLLPECYSSILILYTLSVVRYASKWQGDLIRTLTILKLNADWTEEWRYGFIEEVAIPFHPFHIVSHPSLNTDSRGDYYYELAVGLAPWRLLEDFGAMVYASRHSGARISQAIDELWCNM
eukprot:Gb_16647 [translate_table: standard]